MSEEIEEQDWNRIRVGDEIIYCLDRESLH